MLFGNDFGINWCVFGVDIMGINGMICWSCVLLKFSLVIIGERLVIGIVFVLGIFVLIVLFVRFLVVVVDVLKGKICLLINILCLVVIGLRLMLLLSKNFGCVLMLSLCWFFRWLESIFLNFRRRFVGSSIFNSLRFNFLKVFL